MQVRAIFEAAVSMSNKGVTVLPEIMVPLVGTPQARFLIFFDLSHQGFDYMYRGSSPPIMIFKYQHLLDCIGRYKVVSP